MGFSISICGERFNEGDVAPIARAVDKELKEKRGVDVIFQGNDEITYVGGVSRLARQQIEPLIQTEHKSEVVDTQNAQHVSNISVIVYSAKI